MRYQFVSLRDVPLTVRMDAARREAAKELDVAKRLDLFAAALSPSRRKYAVSIGQHTPPWLLSGTSSSQS